MPSLPLPGETGSDLWLTPAGFPPAPTPNPRREELGQYQLLERLGQGGMGAVYKALHTRLQRIVALKMIRADRLHDPLLLARFRREVNVVGKLDHPHIVRATDAGEENGCPFLVMEFVDGLDLSELARLWGPLPVADACELIRQAALGLQHAHEHGLIHRDIKPSNLMLTADGCVKVLDLGLARLQEDLPPGEELTSSGQVMGTADYLAPEHGEGSNRVDIRADLYSLGCTLYRLLAGQPPFAGPEYSSITRKLWAHAHEQPPPLHERRSDIPPELTTVLDRLLAKSPADRHATPAEVAAALEPLTRAADLPTLLAGARTRQTAARVPRAAALESIQPTPTRSVGGGNSRETDRWFPWKSVRLAGVGLVACLVLLGILWQREVFSHKPTTPPPVEEPAQPGAWQALLARPPKLLEWPTRGIARWGHNEAEQKLWIDVSQEGLLEPGEAPRPPWEVEIKIQQIQWGNTGLFFDYHASQLQRRPCKDYQLIVLSSREKNAPGHHFVLERILVHRLSETSVLRKPLASSRIPHPRGEEHCLRVSLSRTGIEGVFWDEQALPELSDPRINKAIPFSGDGRGVFGTWTSGGSSQFREARYRILEERDR